MSQPSERVEKLSIYDGEVHTGESWADLVEYIDRFTESPLYTEVPLENSDIGTANDMMGTMEELGQIPSG